ncbi:hypothetical protein CBP12_01315 [Oceanisphaera avium]|uniref:Ribose-5-phosphate isomerase A n=2 Tax=Oceanisphaera avium TaxID=1903694 RepID=A0A1Y0CUI5_9GAMM|nr:hypothetical protein CBP12_01315 [Oceanisphaera avium]
MPRLTSRNQLRQLTRHARRQLSPAAQQCAAQSMVNQVSKVAHLASATSVALYLANDGELDTQPLINWYWARGCKVYLPVLHPFCKGHLIFLHYHSATPMHKNHLGIVEPKLDIRSLALSQELDIIYTPLVAFDELGHRLGMGGGFYDRTLSAYLRPSTSSLRPKVVGLAHDCQQVAKLPVAEWDVPLMELLTPTRHFKWSPPSPLINVKSTRQAQVGLLSLGLLDKRSVTNGFLVRRSVLNLEEIKAMTQDEMKKAAAWAALDYVTPNSIVGVGTGSTVNHFIDALGTIKETIKGAVSSSQVSSARLSALGIKIFDLNELDEFDVYVDGADEIDGNMAMIKGGGAALTREKIVAAVAKRFVCIVDESKTVAVLGDFALPVEVIPMARAYVARELTKLGGTPIYREGVITDNGNHILDVHGLTIHAPKELEARINAIVGVVTNGLFAARSADILVIGIPDGVKKYTA